MRRSGLRLAGGTEDFVPELFADPKACRRDQSIEDWSYGVQVASSFGFEQHPEHSDVTEAEAARDHSPRTFVHE